MKPSTLLLVGIVSALLAACGPREPQAPTAQLQSPDGKTLSVEVELADTPEERERGLMERTELPEDTGMLFLFDEPLYLSFWMKNTLIPLDILFFNASGSLISHKSMVPCEAEPCPLYHSEDKAQYVLEVPAGYIQQHGIVQGWKLARP